jgi:4-aminobutyrate aminotransferase-like enzyme/Ser/Thr protein kinase RdoA (MazF antagonist)
MAAEPDTAAAGVAAPAERLLALRARPPQVDARLAEAVARDMFGVVARATSLDGERDRNFRLDATDSQRFVLKFIDHEADDVVVAGQTAVLAHLAEQDPALTVPRLIRTRSGADLGVCPEADCRVRLVTYLPGRPLQERKPRALASDALLRSTGAQVARLDQALRGFFHPALGQPIVWDVRRAPALLSVLPRIHSSTCRHLVADAVEPMPSLLPQLRALRSQAIHGDCHGRNLLADDDGNGCVGIIDLGDMIHAPLVLEIAVTMAELLVDGVASLDRLSQLLAAYAEVQPLERADVEVLYELTTARIALEVLIQTWRGGANTHESEDSCGGALEALVMQGKKRLTAQWLDAVSGGSALGDAASANGTPASGNAVGGTTVSDAAAAHAAADGASRASAELLRRRHAALGSNAELSYDRPLHLVRGDGVWVYTADGERLLDVYNNVPHVGHAHPVVVEAIATQARRIASNTRYLDERIIEYVERLRETLPPDLDTCLFVNSGSEANDIAWRIAKAHTGQGGALVMKYAYHGITDAVTALSPAIATTVAPHIEQLAAPTTNGTAAADAAAAMKRLRARGFNLAALVIDSGLTSTGIYDPPLSWVEPIVAAVRDAGALIIGDEVQFGLGRSGTDFWGFARRGYHPDIVTLGKPVGNGYPLGVVITRRAILEKFQRDTGFFSTFGGNPVAGAAGLAVLDVLARERLVDNARTTGDYFIARLRELAAKYECVKDVRGRGLLIGVEVTDRVLTKQLVNSLRNRAVLIGSEGPNGNVLKLRPPMPFRPEHADIVIEALTAALSDAHP